MRYWKKISLVLVLSSSLAATVASAGDWERLQKKADEIYGGWDVTVTVNTGLEHREYYQGTHTGPYGNLEIQVPIYSRQRRAQRHEEKIKYIEKGAELIRTISENEHRIAILKQKANALRVVMMEEGSAGIQAYYTCMEEVEKLQAGVDEAKKKLEVMLK